MNKEISGKGYIQGGEGILIISTGERYTYHDGELTQTSARPLPATTKPNHNEPKGGAESTWRKAYVQL